MINKIIRRAVVIIVILAISLPAGCSESDVIQDSKSESITLITKYLTRDYRDEIISGARTAANEYGISLFTQSLSSSDDPVKQGEIMNNALESDTKAIILVPEESGELESATHAARTHNVPLVLIDAGLENTDVFCSIATDNRQMVEDVVARLMAAAKPGCTVYIINSICPAGETNEQKELLLSELKECKGFVTTCIDYDTAFQDDLKSQIKSELSGGSGHRAVIALNGFSSTAAIQAIKGLNQNIPLIAYGSSLDLVNEMENGSVNAMVVENAFTKGYMAVQYAMDALKGGARPDDILLKARIVTRENLYHPENQKLIFPLS